MSNSIVTSAMDIIVVVEQFVSTAKEIVSIVSDLNSRIVKLEEQNASVNDLGFDKAKIEEEVTALVEHEIKERGLLTEAEFDSLLEDGDASDLSYEISQAVESQIEDFVKSEDLDSAIEEAQETITEKIKEELENDLDQLKSSISEIQERIQGIEDDEIVSELNSAEEDLKFALNSFDEKMKPLKDMFSLIRTLFSKKDEISNLLSE